MGGGAGWDALFAAVWWPVVKRRQRRVFEGDDVAVMTPRTMTPVPSAARVWRAITVPAAVAMLMWGWCSMRDTVTVVWASSGGTE